MLSLRTDRHGAGGQQKGKSCRQFMYELNLFTLSRSEPIPAASRGAGLAPCHLPRVDSVYIYIHMCVCVCVFLFHLAGIKIAESKIHFLLEPFGRQIKGLAALGRAINNA